VRSTLPRAHSIDAPHGFLEHGPDIYSALWPYATPARGVDPPCVGRWAYAAAPHKVRMREWLGFPIATVPFMTRLVRLALWGALGMPWLFIWQGLDFTDQGYLLTGYRCFFRHPEVTEDSGHMWLVNFVGASWDALFGGLGVLGMRALWALCMSVCVLLAFLLTRALLNARIAALSVLATSVFLSDRHATWFSYNALSTLIFTVSGACLVQGIVQRSSRWLFAAGLALGLGPFARFPNVLGWAAVSAIGLAALLETERRRRLLHDVGLVLLGIACALCGTLLLIYARGDAALYFRGLRSLFEPSMAGAGYSLPALLGQFLQDQGLALVWGASACVGAVVLARALHSVPASVGWLLLSGAGALAVFVLTQKSESWRWAVTGTSYLLLAAVAFGLWRRSLELRVAAFVALAVLFVAPLGSNLGIKNAHMGLWLALPLVLALLHSLDPRWLWGQGAKLALLGAVVLGAEGVHRAATYTYRDSRRSQLRSSIDHPQLRGQFTSPERAKSVGQVLAALEQRVAPGDYLLAYEGTPLLQYLTRTRPYLNRPWLMGWERGEVVQKLAQEAPLRTGCLPVAVLTTQSARGFDWPRDPRPLEQNEANKGARAALGAFLRQHAYVRTWENGFFQIFEPPAERRAPCR
jgi:hypothetical protein